jgi:S1-C subfamily serine protease
MAREVERQSGVEIVEVVPGSPAAAAGLRPEDLVLDVDGVAIESARDLQRLMAAERIGKPVSVRVFRDGTIHEVVATPRELQG